MALLVSSAIPEFTTDAYHGGRFTTVTDRDLRGRWSLVVFYPGDFTFVCPTELEELAENYEQLRALGVEVYAASTDSKYAHKAWHASSPTVTRVQFPMLADPAHRLTKAFGVLDEDAGQAMRATFLADPDGVIRAMEVVDSGIARSVAGMIRTIRSAQHVAAFPAEVCPARWADHGETLTPTVDLVGKI